jgi:hypothetical protein
MIFWVIMREIRDRLKFHTPDVHKACTVQGISPNWESNRGIGLPHIPTVVI